MSNSDLERKIDLQSKLLEMLEKRISSSEKLSDIKDQQLKSHEDDIKRLEEELQREHNRPIQATHSSGRGSGRINLDDIDAVELLMYAEKHGIPWGR